jgi:hypothetical protein
MSLDLSGLSGDTRAALSHLGRQFGSEDVISQADQCVKGLETHQPALSAQGFTVKDGARLIEARDMLQSQLSGRAGVQAQKKGLTKVQRKLVRGSQTARTQARSVAMGVEEDLRLSGEADAECVALGVALEQTRLQEKEPRALADQLEHLSGALGAERIAELVRERGGDDLSGSLMEKVEALRAISEDRAITRGTPEETEAIDVLDGLVVSLLRRARRAAVAAARATGNRAVLPAFTLNLLY